MASSFGAASTAASSADGASASLAWPSGIVATDVVLVCLALGSTTPTPADPSGFTLVRPGLDVTAMRTRIWYHACTGTESGSIPLSWTGGNASYAACAVRYRWVDNSTPIDVSAASGLSSAGTARSAPAANTVRNDLGVYFWCDTSTTGPQTWTITGGTATTQRALAATSASVSRFVSVMTGDTVLPVGSGSSAIQLRGATSGISSSAFVGITVGFTPDTSGGTLPSFEPHTWTDTPIKLFGAPTPPSGQLWPRGVAA